MDLLLALALLLIGALIGACITAAVMTIWFYREDQPRDSYPECRGIGDE